MTQPRSELALSVIGGGLEGWAVPTEAATHFGEEHVLLRSGVKHARFRLRNLLWSVALLVAGCTVTNRDVSKDERFLVGYRPGQVYRLTQAVRVMKFDGNYGLYPPTGATGRGKPAGTLPHGTLIRIISLRHVVTAVPIQWETVVHTNAQTIDDPQQILALQAVSDVRWVNGDYGMKTPVLLPSAQWMEFVSAEVNR